MKKKKSILFFIVLILFISIVIIIQIDKKQNENITNENNYEEIKEKYVQILEDGTKVNVSEKLKENKKIENIILKNITLSYRNGVTTLLANVENTSNEISKQKVVEITLIDEEQKDIYTLQGIIEEIGVGEEKQFNCSITADFTNIYDFVIKEK